MSITMSSEACRVLGVLIEKSLTVPEYYPMTLNAIVTGSNQKTSRDPVMSLSEGDVGAALRELQMLQLVSQAPPSSGARSNRFQHDVQTRFGWGTPMRAVMSELLLRGPQTIGELRGRASRMANIASLEYANEVVAELAANDPPFIAEFPRAPGQSTVRYMHLFLDPSLMPQPAVQHSTQVIATPSSASHQQANDALADRVSALESRIETLESELSALRSRIDG